MTTVYQTQSTNATSLRWISSEFGKTFITANAIARRGVHVPLALIDICMGNETAARLFAQILYWHEPSSETGKPRLTHADADGTLWLEKSHGDWYRETRIQKRTAQRALDYLKLDLHLIIVKLVGSRGREIPWIRINWPEFERRMRIWMWREEQGLNDSPPEKMTDPYDPEQQPLDNLTSPPSQNVQGGVDTLSRGVDNVSLSSLYTKTTTEISLTETTTEQAAAVTLEEKEEKEIPSEITACLKRAGVWKNNWHYAAGWTLPQIESIIRAAQASHVYNPPGFIVDMLQKGPGVIPQPDEMSVSEAVKIHFDLPPDMESNPDPVPVPDTEPLHSDYSDDTLWEATLGLLKMILAPAVYNTWFDGTRLLGRKPGTQIAVIQTPNAYVADMLRSRFYNTLHQQFCRIARGTYEIEFWTPVVKEETC